MSVHPAKYNAVVVIIKQSGMASVINVVMRDEPMMAEEPIWTWPLEAIRKVTTQAHGGTDLTPEAAGRGRLGR